MFVAMNECHLTNKTHVKRYETVFDERFCGTKCFDRIVIFEIRQVERLELGDSLGSIF